MYKLRLNADKCQFGRQEVTYVGHVLSKDGLKPDPEKVRAVEAMKPPQNQKELMTFQGFVQYLAKFLPNMSEVSAPLRQLLGKDTPWEWESQQEEGFKILKTMVTEAPVLTFFDTSKPIMLTVDSTSTGMGAAIIQDKKPVAYASRALTPTQQRYSQIEKETLAIVYGCTKVHQYLYGRKVVVESDHKPLQSMFKKSMHLVPARLQKLLLTLQKYDLEVTYKPGMYVADTLLRAYLEETNETLVEDLTVNEIYLLSYLPVSPEKYKVIKETTESDAEMLALKQQILDGWLETKDKISQEITPYWNYRDEISCIDGLMFKVPKLIVPKDLRYEMLERIHESSWEW